MVTPVDANSLGPFYGPDKTPLVSPTTTAIAPAHPECNGLYRAPSSARLAAGGEARSSEKNAKVAGSKGWLLVYTHPSSGIQKVFRMTIRSYPVGKRVRLLDKSNEASCPLATKAPNIGGNEGFPSLHVRKRTTIWRRKAM